MRGNDKRVFGYKKIKLKSTTNFFRKTEAKVVIVSSLKNPSFFSVSAQFVFHLKANPTIIFFYLMVRGSEVGLMVSSF